MQQDATLHDEYLKFMNEYSELGHMFPLSPLELRDESLPAHYIPYHGIWQRSDNRPKLRVVFNTSRPTLSGLSLNNVLHAGPKLQSDLAAVVTRWRRYRIAFCGRSGRQSTTDPLEPFDGVASRALSIADGHVWRNQRTLPHSAYVETVMP